MRFRDLKKGMRVKYNAKARHSLGRNNEATHIVKEIWSDEVGNHGAIFANGDYVHCFWLEKAN